MIRLMTFVIPRHLVMVVIQAGISTARQHTVQTITMTQIVIYVEDELWYKMVWINLLSKVY